MCGAELLEYPTTARENRRSNGMRAWAMTVKRQEGRRENGSGAARVRKLGETPPAADRGPAGHPGPLPRWSCPLHSLHRHA